MNAVAVEDWLGRAVQAQRDGDWERAEQCYRQVLAQAPEHEDALLELGTVLQARGRADEAVRHLAAAVERCPRVPELYTNLANALHGSGRTGQAVEVYRMALGLRPDYPEALNNLGVALKQLGRWEEAAACLQRATVLKPGYVAALHNLGNVRRHLGDAAGAIDCYRRALEETPADATLHCAVGDACQAAGLLTEAAEFYERALRLEPELPQARWNRALLWLKQGDYARGWPEYEWGFAAGKRPQRAMPYPRWDGRALRGETVHVWGEQGLGDTLQFLRFLPALRARGARIVLEVPPPLRTLLTAFDGADRVVVRDEGAHPPRCDYHLPMMSLPGLLGTRLEDLPGAVPYLRADSARCLQWQQRLDGNGIKIGIVWAGNPAHQNDQNRSCRAREFAALLQQSGTRWFSLQKGPGAAQLAELDRGRITDLSRELTDCAETAAALAHLDLVITVDTAVAHLAGALGRPVWCLLPFDADWRWLSGRSDTPWYPSMRLFRQPRPGDWQSVFAAVARALSEQAERAPARPGAQTAGGDRQRFNHAHAAMHDARLSAARKVLAAVLPAVRPSSILDVGCGFGAWLQAAGEQGVEDIIGVDGAWIDRAQLRIPQRVFHALDLEQPLDLGRRFDLVISLEVAEHLAPACGSAFVDGLVRHSDAVLFSAAIPGQGGNGHVNERFQDQWAAEFARHDFVATDLVRRHVWGDPDVFWWLQQNAVLYLRRRRLGDYPAAARSTVAAQALPVVHPALYLQWLRRLGTGGAQ